MAAIFRTRVSIDQASAIECNERKGLEDAAKQR